MKSENYIPALSYDRLTPFYDTVVRLTTREAVFKKALVAQDEIKANHRILDLACGTGTLAILIKKTQPQAEVIGIDGDAKILKIAGRKVLQEGVEIDFERGMSFALPHADESFDHIFSSLFFHHLTRENKLKTLREVFRVMKTGGKLHVADWGLPANFLMKFASRGIELLDGSETTADNFKGLLPSFAAEAGFREVGETLYFNSFFGTIRLFQARK